jgi:hypothetical protein
MKFLFVPLLLITTLSFSQNKETSTSNKDDQIKVLMAKNDSLQAVIDELRSELHGDTDYETTITDWLKTNFLIEIPEAARLNCSFNCLNYDEALSDDTRKEYNEEYWLGTYQFNEAEVTEDGIVIDLSTDDLSKTMILTENFFTVSYHMIMGSDGQTLIYNFKTGETKLDPEIYAIRILSPEELLVGKDYYDSRDVEDPDYEGHIFESGTYNLMSGEYLFLEKE